MRQLSADSITPTQTMPETSTPSGSHVSPLTQKTTESSKRSHSAHNQQQPVQKQMGNLVAEISALGLESNSQQKTSQQLSRPNQTASNNQNMGTSSVNSTQPTSASTWQQTSPSTANGTAATENSTSKLTTI